MCENTGASAALTTAPGTLTDEHLHPVSRLILIILILLLVYAHLCLFFHATANVHHL